MPTACGAARYGVVSRLIPVGALIAPMQGAYKKKAMGKEGLKM